MKTVDPIEAFEVFLPRRPLSIAGSLVMSNCFKKFLESYFFNPCCSLY